MRHISIQGMFDDASMWVADPFVKRTSCPDVPDKVKKEQEQLDLKKAAE